MVDALRRFGVDAHGDADNTGAWVADRKIGQIGVRVTRNVTKHGFALNVSPDLSYFAGIVPCGITDKGVTSMASELGRVPPMGEVTTIVADSFSRIFGSPR
jgi:lipoyl(octanoyl) transferase